MERCGAPLVLGIDAWDPNRMANGMLFFQPYSEARAHEVIAVQNSVTHLLYVSELHPRNRASEIKPFQDT